MPQKYIQHRGLTIPINEDLKSNRIPTDGQQNKQLSKKSDQEHIANEAITNY